MSAVKAVVATYTVVTMVTSIFAEPFSSGALHFGLSGALLG